MTVGKYIDKLRTERRESGIRSAALESVRLPYKKFLQSSNQFSKKGDNIFTDDWNVLIVVDACRYDLMAEVVSERDFRYPDQFDSRYSVDSATAMWMRKTFIPKFHTEMAETSYVCGNPYSLHELSEDKFEYLDEVWSYAWDNSSGTLPARPVTDRAVSIARSKQPDYLIVHYLQPHCPFINYPDISRPKSSEEFGGGYSGADVWTRLRRGEVRKEDVWKGYKDNLHYVLDDVEILLNNLPMDDVVLTSDHGNALGERWLYGHPWRMPVSCLRKVPWMKISSQDLNEYEPEIEPQAVSDVDVQERLSALGYR